MSASTGQAPAPSGPAPAAAEPAKGQRIKASPLARRLAAEHGVDLALVKGTGPGGRIEKRDIEQFRQAPPEPAPAAVARPAAPAPPPEVAYEDRELSRMRQAIARNMTISKPGAPHIYLTLDVEMDAALALRSQLNGLVGDDERARLSVNDLVLKAAALGLRKCPDLNAWFLDETPPKVRLFRQVNLGIAVPTDEGLFAPVLRDVASKTLGQIATETKGIYDRVRANKPRPDEFVGGTFTVSNLGMLGIDEFQAVLVPPQVGILAVGAATPKAVVRDGQVEVRTIMRVTLSSDHRAVDGVYSARYLQELKRLLEAPLGLVL
jgi:pyruvate dehydrogenase E2 component (dihydrolipoamide acetyltransferase)